MLLLKKQSGGVLDDNEEKLLNEPREMKLTYKENQIETEQGAADDKNSNSKIKKIESPKKLEKIYTTIFGTKPLQNKQIIKINDHSSENIQKFLKYCMEDRKKVIYPSRDDSLSNKIPLILIESCNSVLLINNKKQNIENSCIVRILS